MFGFRTARPSESLDVRATHLYQRLGQVLPALQALASEPGKLDRCLERLVVANPWADRSNLADLTEVVARLSIGVDILSDFLREHELVAGTSDFTVGAIERGIIPPLSAEVGQMAKREQRRRRRNG